MSTQDTNISNGSDQGPGAGSQDRTRQYNRGRGNRGNMRRAQNDINKTAKPKALKDMVDSFIQLERGNALVEVDLEFIKRIGDVYRKVIASVQLQRDRVDQNGDPQELQYLTYGLTAGIGLAAARKYYLSTPESQMSIVSEFFPLSTFNMKIPTGVIPFLDLLGKVSYHDLNIRIKYNELVIKKCLLTALQLLSVNQDFLDDYVPNTNANNNDQNMLQGLQTTVLENVLFYDEASALFMRDKVRKRLSLLLSRPITKTIVTQGGNVQAIISVPQLNVETATRVEILAWLARLDPAVHDDPNDGNFFTNVLACGIALLVKKSWLRDTTVNMNTVDPGFQNIPILQNVTVQAFINACEFNHINEFITPGKFQSYYQGAFAYYSTNISPRLHKFVRMSDQGKTSLGDPSQLVYIQDEDLIDVDTTGDFGFQYRGHKPQARDAYSMVKFEVTDSLVRSAIARITKDVELINDYQIIYGQHLIPIINQNLALDNVLNTGAKYFNM